MIYASKQEQSIYNCLKISDGIIYVAIYKIMPSYLPICYNVINLL